MKVFLLSLFCFISSFVLNVNTKSINFPENIDHLFKEENIITKRSENVEGVTTSEFYFLSTTGHNKIHARMVVPDGKVRGVVQIAHGIAEHIDRYLPFMEFLAQNGFVAVGNDHLGHGKSARTPEELGIFAKKDGWEYVLADMDRLHGMTVLKYPNVPYIFFGHSMGSFLTRHYIILHPDHADLVILCGTGHQKPLQVFGGDLVARIAVVTVGPEKVGKILNQLYFGGNNKDIEELRTKNDWLNRDPVEIDKYNADPLCGFIPKTSMFLDMISGVKFDTNPWNINKMNKQTPVLFISGGDDPVGDKGEGVKRAYKIFKWLGVKDVTMKLYPGARHEILLELNRQEVYDDILNWINKKISKREYYLLKNSY